MFLLSVLIALGSGAAPQASNIQGSWACGPYKMHAPDMTISAVERRTFSPDGSFTGLGKATYSLSDQTEIRVETKHQGTWLLSGDVVRIDYTSAEFLSSDSPILTVAMGQASLDAQMRKKGWSKRRVLAFDQKNLTMVTVDATDKSAEVEVSCSRV